MLPKLDTYSYLVGCSVAMSWYLVQVFPKFIDRLIFRFKRLFFSIFHYKYLKNVYDIKNPIFNALFSFVPPRYYRIYLRTNILKWGD